MAVSTKQLKPFLRRFSKSQNRMARMMFGLSLAVISISASASNYQSVNYQSVMDTSNISISLAENNGEYLVKSAVKATIQNTTVTEFKNVIFGLETMPQWMGVKKATLINRINSQTQRIELIKDMPFPLDDRQTILVQDLVEMTAQRIRITLSSSYEGISKNSKYTRVTPYKGEWILTQKDNNVQVELHQSYDAQLSNSLPRSIVTSNLRKDARQLVEGISSLKL